MTSDATHSKARHWRHLWPLWNSCLGLGPSYSTITLLVVAVKGNAAGPKARSFPLSQRLGNQVGAGKALKNRRWLHLDAGAVKGLHNRRNITFRERHESMLSNVYLCLKILVVHDGVCALLVFLRTLHDDIPAQPVAVILQHGDSTAGCK